MNLTARILIGMGAGLLLGVSVQQLAPAPDGWILGWLVNGLLDVGGQIFIASLKLMVVPLVFVSLVCGAARLGASANMGRLGGKTLGLYLLTTGLAVTLALTTALLFQPGVGAEGPSVTVSYEPRPAPSVKDTLVNIFPTNPIAAMAEGRMLQVIVFALLLGIALAGTGAAGQRIRAVFDDVNQVLMRLITLLIQLAPYGVFCLMATLFASIGLGEIFKLLGYFLNVAGTLILHAVVVYPLLLLLLGRVSPLRFLAKMREPILVAFSTASSGATLPVTLRTVEHRVGVKNEVAAFAVPLGATINMDGTAIMQGVATVFIAQFYAIDLTLADYLMVILTATLASVGTAAVPGVGLITLTMVLTQVGLPVEGIALIIGVDRLLDMMRTSVNVTGDGMVATTVARSEGKLDMEVFRNPDAGRIIESDARQAD